MVTYGEKRAGELKERGYKNAGLYNPEGVGGTHVMYVMKHADKPELEALPKNPEVSPMVSLWKGIMKPFANAALGLAVFGAFLHYVTVGPKEVEEDERKEREKV
jgi:formate dehydrogenase iron-sulfur subunit